MVGGAVRRFVSRLVSRVVWPSAEAHRGARRVVAHEWFTTMGGSDRVAARLVELTGAEVVYVFALDRRLVERLGVQVPVVTWRYGEALARVGSFHTLLPVMPLVWRALDLSSAGLVVTSSHACVNAISAPGARRISYVHTPMRYVWYWRLERERVGPPVRWLLLSRRPSSGCSTAGGADGSTRSWRTLASSPPGSPTRTAARRW